MRQGQVFKHHRCITGPQAHVEVDSLQDCCLCTCKPALCCWSKLLIMWAAWL